VAELLMLPRLPIMGEPWASLGVDGPRAPERLYLQHIVPRNEKAAPNLCAGPRQVGYRCPRSSQRG
jgi:hypothetical protein